MRRNEQHPINPWLLIAIGFGLVVMAVFFYRGYTTQDSFFYSRSLPGWISLLLFIVIGVLVRLGRVRHSKREHHRPDETPIRNDDYISFGFLDPLLGRRIIECLLRDRVRCFARDASQMDVASAGTIDSVSWRDPYPRPARNNRIELFVHRDDAATAQKLIDQM